MTDSGPRGVGLIVGILIVGGCAGGAWWLYAGRDDGHPTSVVRRWVEANARGDRAAVAALTYREAEAPQPGEGAIRLSGATPDTEWQGARVVAFGINGDLAAVDIARAGDDDLRAERWVCRRQEGRWRVSLRATFAARAGPLLKAMSKGLGEGMQEMMKGLQEGMRKGLGEIPRERGR